MGLALGFAFREKPPEKIPVGIESGALPASNLAAVSRDPDLLVQEYADAAEARRALTFGRIALLVEPGTPLRYRYDPTRPESRAARLAFDRAAQHAAGGRDPLAVTSELVREKGSRYIDFLPNLAEPDGNGHVGHRVPSSRPDQEDPEASPPRRCANATTASHLLAGWFLVSRCRSYCLRRPRSGKGFAARWHRSPRCACSGRSPSGIGLPDDGPRPTLETAPA
jgi:hypothetical protein